MKLARVSASQVKDYALCKRKWYISHVLKEKGPENQSLKDGNDLHEELEDYLVGGAVVQRVTRKGVTRDARFPDRVSAAAPYLPPAPVASSLHVERWIEQPTYKGGPLWVGKVDILDASTQRLKIWDHKSCKNFKYALAPEALGTDIQMSAYGWHALTSAAFSTKDRETVELAHTYIRLEGQPDVRPVSSVATKDTIRETWNKSLELVSEMEVTAEALNWQDVPPNVDVCQSYGGCPYREKCGFVTEVDRIVKGGKMGLSLIERLEAEKNGAPAQVAGHDVPQSIIPPDAPPRDAVQEEVPKVKRARKVATAEAAEQKTSAPVESVVEQPMETNTARVAETQPTSIVPRVKPSKFDLYVDCMDLFGNEQKPVPFEHIMAPILEKVSEEAGVADPRFIKYEAKARVATHLRLMLDKLPRVILVSSMHTWADTFLEVTVPYANKYVRALRG